MKKVISILLIIILHGCASLKGKDVDEGQENTKGNEINDDIATLYFSYLDLAKRFHKAGSLAPNSATMTMNGDILGNSIIEKDGSDVTVEGALSRFKESQRKEAKKSDIRASAIFYHGHMNEGYYRPALQENEANAIIAYVESPTQSLVFILPYVVDQNIEYGGLEVYEKEAEIFVE